MTRSHAALALVPVSDKPTVPVVYEEAVRSLRACISLDEAKHFADKAEALAAYAAIYRDGRLHADAKRLKLHAYRRMGQLAEEMAAHGWDRKGPGVRDTPRTHLRERGFGNSAVSLIRGVTQLPQRRFNAAIAMERPPSPGTLVDILSHPSPGWARIHRALSVLRAIQRHNGHRGVADAVSTRELAGARSCAIEVMGWLREFEQRLGQRKP